MTAMGSRVGQGAAGTTAIVVGVSSTALGYINTTMEIATPESGLQGEAMAVECRAAAMEAVLWGSSSAVPNTDSATITSEMVIGMWANTLGTRSKDLEGTTSPMANITRGHGMKAVNKVLEHTPSKAVKPWLENGIVGL
ncbi:hypothetical protein KSP40_PGU019555 [Platanthera guangdongensis]|uniref:Uncharacterized protein n=1 Tax=Platanthera guangdongensis TaxID=2320717 RepID=A0ABR2N350_9ASPA